jgi:hypothetical protein
VFLTTNIHARGIPACGKIFAIATLGTTSRQPGKLILTSAKGRQEGHRQARRARRETKAVVVDAYGQDGDLFASRFPIDERVPLACTAPRAGTWSTASAAKSARTASHLLDGHGRQPRAARLRRGSRAAGPPLRPRARPPQRPACGFPFAEGTL